MFEDAGMKMPPLTEFVMNVANFMHTYWYAVVGIVGLGIFLLVRTVKTPKGKEFFDKKILKVPLMGPLMRIVAVARFTRTMSTLLSSGVPILVAFDIAAETCGNTLISKAVFVARDSIKEGNTIAQPLEASGEFPLMVTQMIEVGEESGTITEMLDKVSDFLESDIRRLLTMVVAAMEPFAIVLMAVMVGTIVIAMFLPMFDIADAVSK
jgi:type IV pilus assembly protein PilC